jgi:hypothetical protein
MREQRAERMEQHHRKLHEALKLNPEQEVAWKADRVGAPDGQGPA